MNRARHIWLCATGNLRKWKTDWRIWMVAIGMLAFSYWNIAGIGDFAADNGVKAGAWIFPALFMHPMMPLVFGVFTTLLFCDAPFADAQIAAWVTRCGRMDWILAQVLYVLVASAIYTVFLFFASVLALVPNVTFAPEWGKVYYAILSLSGEEMRAYGIVAVYPDFVLNEFTPGFAMGVTFLMTWLTSAFMGTLILFGNLVFTRKTGVCAGAFLSFFSYFCGYVGMILFGTGVFWVSPVIWLNIANLSWSAQRAIMPPPLYGIIALSVSILVFSAVSIAAFCKKDVDIQEGGIL